MHSWGMEGEKAGGGEKGGEIEGEKEDMGCRRKGWVS